MKTYISFVLLFLSLSIAQGQTSKKQQKRINEHCQDGENALRKLKFEAAIGHFKKALEINDTFPPAYRGIGAAYQLSNQYAKAAEAYEKAASLNPFFSRALYYDIGFIYYRSGNYSKAIQFFEQFKKLQALPPGQFGPNGQMEAGTELKYRQRIEDDLHACYYARDSIPFMEVQSIANLGDSINTQANEYFPFLTNQQDLLFFTKQLSPLQDENLMVSQRADSTWRWGEMVEGNFNSPLNEGMCTMTRDGVQLFFTACGRRYVQGACDIYSAKVKGKEVVSVSPLKGVSNSPKWESQASISCDGTELYFASNRAGGLGGTDIWVSHLLSDGTWSEAENLGPLINTSKDEEAPFISIDGSMLFFSSTGHLGFGEQDIFASRRTADGPWQRPVNLGPPVNTAYRELGFFLSADSRDGYISSDRPGGRGQMDIYGFELSKVLSSIPITLVEGYVKDSISLAPVSTLLEINGRSDIASDETGRFFICLPADQAFSFSINEQSYLPYQRQEMIPFWDNKAYYPMEVLLQAPPSSPRKAPPPDLLRAQNVFFEFDQDQLSDTAIDSLNFYIDNLRKHQYTTVYIDGYTDFKGSNQYNQRLSERRAKAVADYLRTQGILIEDIQMKGKGEINDQQPRWINRRVEIRTKVE